MPSGGGAARGRDGYALDGSDGSSVGSGVVLHSPQTLVPSSTGTTPPGPNASSAGSAWCFSPHKPLSLRRRAPRPQAQTRVPPARRGASLPANPCSFVDGRHALRLKREFRRLGVVLLSPQTLVLSSTSTTPPGTNRPSTNPTWCFIPRKPLSLRRRAPRPQAQTRVSPVRRGASLPANPCSFVDEHHAPRHEPTFPGPAALRRWKRHRRFLLLPTKKQKGAVALNSAAVLFSCTFFEAVLMQFLMKPLKTTAFIKK